MEQKIARKILQIDGMTCASCEMRIENAIKKLEGVVNTKAIFSCSNVYITYDARVNLEAGENDLKFTSEADFTFRCWMGMLNGYVKVVDDINEINLEEIKAEVEVFKPAGGAGGGGCCG